MNYCKNNNIIVYEQDWMSNNINRFSYLRNTIDGAVTHCRTSDDYHGYTFKTYDVPGFTQSSLLAHVLGLRPFKDVFKTKKYPFLKYRGERIPDLECLLSSLSTGPVAPGDRYCDMNKDIIIKSCRKDGKLLQPTFPLTAIDLMYIKNETYYIASAETRVQIKESLVKWYFVLTINLFPKRVKNYSYSLYEVIDVNSEYIEFQMEPETIRIVNLNSVVDQRIKFEEYRYRVYAPVFNNGISIIGNPSKYATFNEVQFKIQEITDSYLELLLLGLLNENIPLIIGVKNEYKYRFSIEGKEIKCQQMHQNDGYNALFQNDSALSCEKISIFKLNFQFHVEKQILIRIEIQKKEKTSFYFFP